MKAKGLFTALAVVAFLVGHAGALMAQTPSQDAPELTAQESLDLRAEIDIILSESVGLSINAVDVYLLRCTTTPFGFVQFARARVGDNGGVDGRRIYLQLTRKATGRTSKVTAPDGGLSGLAAVVTGGAGSDHFIVVGKDRASSVAETYTIGADCIAGGLLRPHTLVLIQNQ
jgi:hypothetical protein